MPLSVKDQLYTGVASGVQYIQMGDGVRDTADLPKAWIDNGESGVVDLIPGDGLTIDDTDPKHPKIGLNDDSKDSLAKADTALQPEDLADHNDDPTAHQDIRDRVESLENLGHFIGSFDTRALVPTNISDFTHQPITVNDFITVRSDETRPPIIDEDGDDDVPVYPASRYIVEEIADNGDITWAYDMSYTTDVTGKMDKEPGAADGNLAAFLSGQAVDSGKKPSDFIPVERDYTVYGSMPTETEVAALEDEAVVYVKSEQVVMAFIKKGGVLVPVGSPEGETVVVDDRNAKLFPNLEVGVETPWPELWNGRRMYRKLVKYTINNLPGDHEFPLSDSFAVPDLEFIGVDVGMSYSTGNGGYVPLQNTHSGGEGGAWIRATNGVNDRLNIWTSVDRSPYTYHVVYWYTKKADPIIDSTIFYDDTYLKESLPGIGTIEPIFGDTPNEGTLLCDGSALLRSDFPELANHLINISSDYAIGTDQFVLPDLRGQFLRGKDASRLVGSAQLDALQNIMGEGYFRSLAITGAAPWKGALSWGVGDTPIDTLVANAPPFVAPSKVSFDASLVARTADETRPVNVAINWCIRYKRYEVAKNKAPVDGSVIGVSGGTALGPILGTGWARIKFVPTKGDSSYINSEGEFVVPKNGYWKICTSPGYIQNDAVSKVTCLFINGAYIIDMNYATNVWELPTANTTKWLNKGDVIACRINNTNVQNINTDRGFFTCSLDNSIDIGAHDVWQTLFDEGKTTLTFEEWATENMKADGHIPDYSGFIKLLDSSNSGFFPTTVTTGGTAVTGTEYVCEDDGYIQVGVQPTAVPASGYGSWGVRINGATVWGSPVTAKDPRRTDPQPVQKGDVVRVELWWSVAGNFTWGVGNTLLAYFPGRASLPPTLTQGNTYGQTPIWNGNIWVPKPISLTATAYDLYVDPNGEDNPLAGYDAAHPLKTINYALKLGAALKGAAAELSIKLADGDYNEGLFPYFKGLLWLEGNQSTPENVRMGQVYFRCAASVEGVTFRKDIPSTAGEQYTCCHIGGCRVDLYRCIFDSVVTGTPVLNDSWFRVGAGGILHTSECRTKGNAGRAVVVSQGSVLNVYALTLQGPLVCNTSLFYAAEGGKIAITSAITTTGAISGGGKRYELYTNADLTLAANIPTSNLVAGTTATGARVS